MLTSQYLVYETMDEDMEYTFNGISRIIFNEIIERKSIKGHRLIRILYSLRSQQMLEIIDDENGQWFKKIIRC